MSEETITLELVGARLMTLTADVRDLQSRFDDLGARLGAPEGGFGAMERGFAVQEGRMSRMLPLIVRIAERQGLRE